MVVSMTGAMEVAAVTDIHPDAQVVLDFWFRDHGHQHWFNGGQRFDVEIRIAFAKTVVRGQACELWDWRATPQGRLAEIIVIDQFSRNLFRQSGRAFAADPLALGLAQELVARGDITSLADSERIFALLPYMHSESLAVHDAALPLFKRYTDDNTVQFEIGHRDVIARFGRYPKRNEALGRVSTAEEIAYMQEDEDRAF